MGSRPAGRKDRPPVPERGWRRSTSRPGAWLAAIFGGLERGRQKSVVQRKNEGIKCIGYEGKGAWERKD
jgi:hypothetical protein